jgi:hypothetical protein
MPYDFYQLRARKNKNKYNARACAKRVRAQSVIYEKKETLSSDEKWLTF